MTMMQVLSARTTAQNEVGCGHSSATKAKGGGPQEAGVAAADEQEAHCQGESLDYRDKDKRDSKHQGMRTTGEKEGRHLGVEGRRKEEDVPQ